MIKIYHNNRCSKSRCGLDILEQSGQPFEVIKYLENTPTYSELENIINLLGINPIQLIRKNEAIWKEKYKNQDFSDSELIEIMINNSKLIERPIVINGNRATIGRPPESILDII